LFSFFKNTINYYPIKISSPTKEKKKNKFPYKTVFYIYFHFDPFKKKNPVSIGGNSSNSVRNPIQIKINSKIAPPEIE
jgi:hypothetical protein